MKKALSMILVIVLALLTVSFSLAEEETNEIKETITVENNEEFAALLQLKNEYDPSVKVFAEKYAGQEIEFDCNIAYMNYHGSFKTRYDILIVAGDYSEVSMSGPYFQFNDVSVVYDLNLTGDNVPDYIGMGDNLHIIAVVGDYNEFSGLFQLDPVSTMVR